MSTTLPVRWNAFPVPRLSLFQREMDELLKEFVTGPISGSFTERGWFAPVSLWEDDAKFYADVELPGIRPEDLDVTVEGPTVNIKAERKAPTENRKYWHQERAFGRLERVIRLPESADSNGVEAHLADGVLHLAIAKRPETQARKVAIKAQ